VSLPYIYVDHFIKKATKPSWRADGFISFHAPFVPAILPIHRSHRHGLSLSCVFAKPSKASQQIYCFPWPSPEHSISRKVLAPCPAPRYLLHQFILVIVPITDYILRAVERQADGSNPDSWMGTVRGIVLKDSLRRSRNKIRYYWAFGFCQASCILNNTTFRKLDVFRHQVTRVGETYCVSSSGRPWVWNEIRRINFFNSFKSSGRTRP
jgi:hypothetical protein